MRCRNADVGASHAFALSEAIPDATLHLRAVLRVLAKKGIPVDQLVHEIDAGLEVLVAKQAAWAEKADSRRSARAEDRKNLDLQYEKLVFRALRNAAGRCRA